MTHRWIRVHEIFCRVQRNQAFLFASIWKRYIFLAGLLFDYFPLSFCPEGCAWSSALGLLYNDAANCDIIRSFFASEVRSKIHSVDGKWKKKGGNGTRFLERQTQRQGFLTRLLSDGPRPGCVSVRAIESLPAIKRNFCAKRKKRVAWRSATIAVTRFVRRDSRLSYCAFSDVTFVDWFFISDDTTRDIIIWWKCSEK